MFGHVVKVDGLRGKMEVFIGKIKGFEGPPSIIHGKTQSLLFSCFIICIAWSRCSVFEDLKEVGAKTFHCSGKHHLIVLMM